MDGKGGCFGTAELGPRLNRQSRCLDHVAQGKAGLHLPHVGQAGQEAAVDAGERLSVAAEGFRTLIMPPLKKTPMNDRALDKAGNSGILVRVDCFALTTLTQIPIRGPTGMPLSDPELWSRIEAFAMPVPPKGRWRERNADTFEKGLVRDFDFSAEDAARLVIEYRKFLYLKAIDGGLLSPPPDIDDVWHKHIESPDGAWEKFCNTVIGKPLEHRTGLSKIEAQTAGLRARELYEREFGDAPTDIWPGPAENRRKAVAGVIEVAGILLFVSGLVVSAVGSTAGYGPELFWTSSISFGGLGLLILSSMIGSGASVARNSGCG